MAFDAHTSPEYDAQLSEAIAYRLENYGMRSARKLLSEVEHISSLLSLQPFMGSLVDANQSGEDPEALRWIRTGFYISAYRPHPKDGIVVLEKLFYASSNWRERVLS